jgi:hypothetical protein
MGREPDKQKRTRGKKTDVKKATTPKKKDDKLSKGSARVSTFFSKQADEPANKETNDSSSDEAN